MCKTVMHSIIPNILIFDDDLNFLELYREYFINQHNITVTTASTAEEALVCVHNLLSPSVVILDRRFKNRKGEVVLGENLLPLLKQETRSEFVTIFHSGDVSKKSHLNALRSGADWYVPKGSDFDIMMAYVWKARDVIVSQIVPRLDPLTKAFNRQLMYDYAIRELSHAGRTGTSTACLMFDLDDLKVVNSKFSYFGGDRAIVAMVDIIREHLRATDIVCRFGGDEVFVVLSDAKEEWSREFAKSTREAISQKKIPKDPKDPAKGEFNISASVGITMLEPGRITELIHCAQQQHADHAHRSSQFRELMDCVIAETNSDLFIQKAEKNRLK